MRWGRERKASLLRPQTKFARRVSCWVSPSRRTHPTRVEREEERGRVRGRVFECSNSWGEGPALSSGESASVVAQSGRRLRHRPLVRAFSTTSVGAWNEQGPRPRLARGCCAKKAGAFLSWRRRAGDSVVSVEAVDAEAEAEGRSLLFVTERALGENAARALWSSFEEMQERDVLNARRPHRPCV